ncbi:MAG TPA: 23S rRNA (guanosine(2251)-2'-O)-methyltransferase RlmB [Actinomycetota bacterium]|nr:23S rRNA (guanosine(2251)-2'-O)-methyltransferase RlmB [Actinomycetota bacterium]
MDLIEGRQPVREALRAGRPLHRILIAEGAHSRGALAEIVELARAAGVRIDRVPRAAIEARATTKAHQGVLAEGAARAPRSWREGLAGARAAGELPLFLALDGIEDPHNAGALVRSAEAFGAHAVLIPKRRSSPLSAAMAKASAGALEHIVVDQVTNLERALASCREEGLWLVALSGDGDVPLERCTLLEEPVVLVVGKEGTGVSSLIRKRADAVCSIPLAGRVGSLNASVAGAVALWETARRRRVLRGSDSAEK